jgi:17beta-estradiol 17-dehydrogenase / very-long-chain 3-oxoacyl-CoA reductase
MDSPIVQKILAECDCVYHSLKATPLWLLPFVAVGALVVLKFVLSLLALFYRHLLRPSKSMRAYGAGKGAWAVVTGATDGIGKEYAKQLARKGFNVLIISRSQERLDSTAAEIKEGAKNAEVKTHAADLSALTEQSIEKLKAVLSTLDIGVLVNNAGVSYDHPMYFLELQQKDLRHMIELNCRQMTELTYIVLPGMVDRKRGLIINLSSGSGIFPTPLLALYSGTKAYVKYFSRALAAEYKSKGIHVECQVPFLVASKLSKARPALMVPTPSAYVRAALAGVGRCSLTSPSLAHDLMKFYLKSMPRSYAIGHLFSRMAYGRKRALQRKQASAAKHD